MAASIDSRLSSAPSAACASSTSSRVAARWPTSWIHRHTVLAPTRTSVNRSSRLYRGHEFLQSRHRGTYACQQTRRHWGPLSGFGSPEKGTPTQAPCRFMSARPSPNSEMRPFGSLRVPLSSTSPVETNRT